MRTKLWNMVQKFEAGASHKVCQMGGSNYPFDTRGYGDALQETGYPLIHQWVEGRWDEACRAEYGQFLKAAIAQGSFPMLAVAAIPAKCFPTIYEEAMLGLSRSQRQRLKELINIGSGNDDYGKYIKELKHVGQEDRIQRATGGNLEARRGRSEGSGTGVIAT